MCESNIGNLRRIDVPGDYPGLSVMRCLLENLRRQLGATPLSVLAEATFHITDVYAYTGDA